MTLDDFKQHLDWQRTFKVAFGLGLETLEHEQYSPIHAVRRVFCCGNMGNGRQQYSYAVVEFGPGDGPYPYALVTSHVDGKEWVGDVVYFEKPPVLGVDS